jgi:signal transduction histidine kinase
VSGRNIELTVAAAAVGLVTAVWAGPLRAARRRAARLAEDVAHHAALHDLMAELPRVADSPAAPLLAESVARWAARRLELLFAPDLAAVALHDLLAGGWTVVHAEGVSASSPVPSSEHLLGGALNSLEPVVVDDLDHGLGEDSRWGLYGPMRARGEAFGVLVVENARPRRASATDRRRLADIAQAAAMAIENARWLERVRALGIEQERARLARELHDHIGQSVVSLGFELDRLVQLNYGRAVQSDLAALRSDVRDLAGELREMLVDLRCDVSETQGVDAVLASFLDRVNRRHRVAVTLFADAEARLPLAVEREFWRVAREAVINAERHARATTVSVLWICNPGGALLEVSDDGIGLPSGLSGSGSEFGLLGMRERAQAVGANLEVASWPEAGTTVRMRIRAA